MRTLHGSALASFRQRSLALGVDLLIAGSLFMVVPLGILVASRRLGVWEPTSDVNLQLTFFGNWYSIAWLVLYFGLATYFGKGQTPGKRLLGIRVVSLAHERLSFWHSLERALGYGASALEFGFGFLQYFLHPNRRTVHDRIADTIVITERGPRKSGEPVPPA